MKTCNWTHDLDTDSWDTDCDEKFQLTNGNPKQNKMKFCCYCGKQLTQTEEDEQINTEYINDR